MATRPKTSAKTADAPTRRTKTAPSQDKADPAQPKPRRRRGAEAAPSEPAAAPAEPPPAVTGTAGDESGMVEAIRALREVVAAGNDALAALRDEVRAVGRRLDQLADARAQPAAPSPGADDDAAGRDRDPGDAVPPGVAPVTPVPLTETDEAVLHTLEDLPKRTGRGRRGARAKT